MDTHISSSTKKSIVRVIAIVVCSIWTVMNVLPQAAQAQAISFRLPSPGSMVRPSIQFAPPTLQGIKIHPDNPLLFDFLINPGDQAVDEFNQQNEAQRLVKYFLAALTTPENDMWVNLSPHEQDRIVPDGFGQTEMGRDLLAQDYILKQLTASLIYPEDELGKTFWNNVYQRAYEQYGTTDIPVNTFNKVWITPDTAEVFEQGTTAVIGERRLKVMLESDYTALKVNFDQGQFGMDHLNADEATGVNDISSDVVRNVILPAIEKEVNEGENFQQLRQIYDAMVLAAWFKRRLEKSILNKIYVNQDKVMGVDIGETMDKNEIYAKYIDAYKTGVYDFIKEEYDPFMDQEIPRKYFSGGGDFAMKTWERALEVRNIDGDQAMASKFRDWVGEVADEINKPLIGMGVLLALVGGSATFVINDFGKTPANQNGAEVQEAASAPSVEEFSNIVLANYGRTFEGTNIAQGRLEGDVIRRSFEASQIEYLLEKYEVPESEWEEYQASAQKIKSAVLEAYENEGLFSTERSQALVSIQENLAAIQGQGSQQVGQQLQKMVSLAQNNGQSFKEEDLWLIIDELYDAYRLSDMVPTGTDEYGYIQKMNEEESGLKQILKSFNLPKIIEIPENIRADRSFTIEIGSVEAERINNNFRQSMDVLFDGNTPQTIDMSSDQVELAFNDSYVNESIRDSVNEALIARGISSVDALYFMEEAMAIIQREFSISIASGNLSLAVGEITDAAMASYKNENPNRIFDNKTLAGLFAFAVGTAIVALVWYNLQDSSGGTLQENKSRHQEALKMLNDQAMTVRGVNPAQERDFTKGGIDLNKQFLNLTTDGEAIDVMTPDQLKYLETTPINGFVPNILNITPGTINTLPFFSEMRSTLVDDFV